MKKSLSHTRVSVKLRKAEFRKEWYLYIESYPVISKTVASHSECASMSTVL